jgi:phosphatidylserine/phosphatidylglycerophosphate/cardiolipin synthase-like enzyme
VTTDAIHPLRRLSRVSLQSLADGLSCGRLSPPFSEHTIRSVVPDGEVSSVATALRELDASGMQRAHIATMLGLLAEERAATQREVDRVRAVWSPPEFDHIDARDTVAVVRDLFNEASKSVEIVTFALDEGDKAKALFGELAARMISNPDLRVRVFANVHRKHLDDASPNELVREFRYRFQTAIWPGERLPEVFYDPRSIADQTEKRAVLHAKAVVVDRRKTLLTSANFTEAAHARNIEAGVLIEDAEFAVRMVRQLDYLIEEGALVSLRVPERKGAP